MPIWLLLTGCSLLADLDARPAGIEHEPYEVAGGTGWSVRVPAGSAVRAGGSTLAVDAPDGRRWFDVRWLDERPAAPQIAAIAWGEERCRPFRLDLPAQPVDGVWTAGGQCSIEHRRHHVIVAVEQHGDRTLLTGMIGALGRVTYEDLWVDYVHTALSLSAGEAPRDVVTPARVREIMRDVEQPDPEALLPVPGGGTFSLLVSEGLAPVWADRQVRELPAAFDGAGERP